MRMLIPITQFLKNNKGATSQITKTNAFVVLY